MRAVFHRRVVSALLEILDRLLREPRVAGAVPGVSTLLEILARNQAGAT